MNSDFTHQHSTFPVSGSWPDSFSELPSLPLFEIFLPSFARSIASSSDMKYVIYFGYDGGDAVFDNQSARVRMDKMLDSTLRGLPVEWKWFKCARLPATCLLALLYLTAALEVRRNGGESVLDLRGPFSSGVSFNVFKHERQRATTQCCQQFPTSPSCFSRSWASRHIFNTSLSLQLR